MKVISLITLVLGLFLAPCPSQAQSVAKMPRIGILTPTSDPNPDIEAFRQGLRDLGYMEGQSIALEYRFAEGRFERLPELAAELVRLKVDIILAEGGQATAAARHATETIPIVFPAVPDPVGQGLVASLAQPGGNTTGLSFQDPELMGKRLELLKEAVPGVTRVAYLWHSSRTSAHVLQELETAARALGVQLQSVEVRDPYPFDQAFAERLYADLQNKGVRCWYAPEDMKIGDEFRSRIDASIHLHDRLLLILSAHSLKSRWVQKEVETAFEKEEKDNRLVLFPIRLDDTVMQMDVGWAADIRRQRHIGNFTQWKEHDAYQQAFARLLRDLTSAQKTPEA